MVGSFSAASTTRHKGEEGTFINVTATADQYSGSPEYSVFQLI